MSRPHQCERSHTVNRTSVTLKSQLTSGSKCLDVTIQVQGSKVHGSGLKIALWTGSKHLRRGDHTNKVGRRDKRDARSRRRAMAASKRTPVTRRYIAQRPIRHLLTLNPEP